MHNSTILEIFWTSFDPVNQELAMIVVRQRLNNMSKKKVIKVLNNVTRHGHEWNTTFIKVMSDIIENKTKMRLRHYCKDPLSMNRLIMPSFVVL